MTDKLKAIIETVGTYLPEFDTEVIERAYAFAAEAHEGQFRKSGEPFINHPVEVATILADLHMDPETVVVALLHDTVEDSDITLEEVDAQFGPEITQLVDGVTKLSRLDLESLSEAQSNNLRKMLIAMSKDIRVIIIKLADRLHNMRTLMALREDRRIFKARETMEIYAPLAHRLGMSSIKWELEDLSFFYLEPNKFHQVSRMVAESRTAREEYLNDTIDTLRTELEKVGIKAEIAGRPKHLYSIYQKMSQRGKDFSEIYDLIALRVIVDSVKDCYGALGTAHSLWKPMPGRFKDYIAMPKFNMYQSLHTTVIGIAGRPLEIQIRTEEMHQTAEYGIAAHWRYKEGATKADDFEERLSWLRQMLEWQTELKDPGEFMEALKVDLFDTEVFVFSPKGDVISLRAGSTPIDFAYAIHTEVGNHCVGAKVNGSIVPLAYELQMGDRVSILTNKSANPSRDWLNIVKTSSARSKIRSYFSKANRGDDLVRGRDELAREMRKHGKGIGSSASTRALEAVAKELSHPSMEDMLVAIGAGKVSEKIVASRVLKILEPDSEKFSPPTPTFTLDTPMIAPRAHRRKRTESGVVVKGVDDVLVRLSRCCNPVPGDEIIGFVTRGRGVSVHRADCPNAKELRQTPERLLDVEWDTGISSAFQVEVYIEALDRTRLLQDVIVALSEAGADILTSSTSSHSDGIVEMRFLFEISELGRLDQILKEVRAVDGVFEAKRMLPGDASRKKKGRS